MKIKDVLSSEVKGVRAGATVQDAAEKMRSLDIGLLPVVDEQGKLAGVITDRDIVIRSTAGGNDPKRTLVSEVMTQEVFLCQSDEDVAVAAKIMRDKKVRRLLVTDQGKN